MKKVYLFLMMLACGTAGFAQAFTISPSPTVDLNIPEGIDGHATIYFTNQNSGNLTLVWDLASNTLNSGWDISICDNNLCYFNAHPGDTMMPVSGGQNGFLKFTCKVNPGQTGTGSLSYNVHAAGDPTSTVEVTFNVNGLVSVKDVSFANQVTVSPNPVSSQLTVRATNGKLEKGEVQIYSLTGKLLREVEVRGTESMDIDVQELATGTYLLRYLSDKGTVTRRFLKTN